MVNCHFITFLVSKHWFCKVFTWWLVLVFSNNSYDRLIFYMFAWLDLNPDYAPEMNIGAPKNATFISSKFECLQKGFCLAFAATIICHNDELSSSFTWLEILNNSVFQYSAIRYKKSRRMGIKGKRRIWLISVNQVKLKLSLWQIIVTNIW